MGFEITSESQIIDKAAIDAGCNQIDKTAENLGNCASQTKKLSEVANSDMFYVDGFTLEEPLAVAAGQIEEYESTIKGVTASIRSQAEQLYNSQMQEYKRYQEYLAEEERKRREQSSSN